MRFAEFKVSNYVYSEQGRRPIQFFVVALGLAFVAMLAAYQQPWFFYLPPALAAAMSLYAIVENRRSGMALQDSTMQLYSGSWSQVIDMRDVMGVREVRWSDGAPDIMLLLRNGGSIKIPGACFGSGSKLMAALTARGLPVT
jgi:hypothetical protein